MGDALPTPSNKALTIIQIVLEKLIEGLGVDLAISAATSAEPWLATPIIKQIFQWVVEKFAAYIDENLFKIAIKITIRIQSSSRKEEYNNAIIPIVQGNPTPAEIQAARDAADRLINRNR